MKAPQTSGKLAAPPAYSAPCREGVLCAVGSNRSGAARAARPVPPRRDAMNKMYTGVPSGRQGVGQNGAPLLRSPLPGPPPSFFSHPPPPSSGPPPLPLFSPPTPPRRTRYIPTEKARRRPGGAQAIRVFRVLRAMRTLRVVRRSPRLMLVINTVTASIRLLLAAGCEPPSPPRAPKKIQNAKKKFKTLDEIFSKSPNCTYVFLKKLHRCHHKFTVPKSLSNLTLISR